MNRIRNLRFLEIQGKRQRPICRHGSGSYRSLSHVLIAWDNLVCSFNSYGCICVCRSNVIGFYGLISVNVDPTNGIAAVHCLPYRSVCCVSENSFGDRGLPSGKFVTKTLRSTAAEIGGVAFVCALGVHIVGENNFVIDTVDVTYRIKVWSPDGVQINVACTHLKAR